MFDLYIFLYLLSYLFISLSLVLFVSFNIFKLDKQLSIK